MPTWYTFYASNSERVVLTLISAFTSLELSPSGTPITVLVHVPL